LLPVLAWCPLLGSPSRNLFWLLLAVIAVPHAAISQADIKNATDLTERMTKKTAAKTLEAADKKGFTLCKELVDETLETLLEELFGEEVAGEFLGELFADVLA
jgi:hypothetical protein